MSQGGEQSRDVEHDAGERRPSRFLISDYAKMDEFTRLVKYTSTYRERDARDADEGEIRFQRVWYAPWRQKKFRWKYIGSTRAFPQEWLVTDIRKGLSESDVSERRKTAGFNELAVEKENLFAKFLSYFQGPILYGSGFLPCVPCFELRLMYCSDGDCWSARCGIGGLD